MKRTFTIILFTIFAFGSFAQKGIISSADYAENAEIAPITQKFDNTKGVDALWDLQFSFNASDSAGGDVGMAGIAFFNNEFWVSRWANDTIYRFDINGALISEFVIPSLTGTRAITTDGTSLFFAVNTTMIYKVNPNTLLLEEPHITSLSTVGNVRFATYDSTLDGGLGGFWVGNFNTDIEAISMTGTVLQNIPVATHGLSGMYGAAADNYSDGGPYLWVFSQEGTNSCMVTGLNISDGTQTGNAYDPFPVLQTEYTLSSGLAGGAFFTSELVSGKSTFLGLVQSDPGNVVFALELIQSSVSINELSNGALTVFPNPAEKYITAQFNAEQNITASIEIHDISGRLVYTEILPANSNSATVNIENLESGIYILSIINGENKIFRKIVKQ